MRTQRRAVRTSNTPTTASSCRPVAGPVTLYCLYFSLSQLPCLVCLLLRFENPGFLCRNMTSIHSVLVCVFFVLNLAYALPLTLVERGITNDLQRVTKVWIRFDDLQLFLQIYSTSSPYLNNTQGQHTVRAIMTAARMPRSHAVQEIVHWSRLLMPSPLLSSKSICSPSAMRPAYPSTRMADLRILFAALEPETHKALSPSITRTS